MAAAERLHVVQLARAISPGHGVSGPAWALERELTDLGHRCDRLTLRELGIRRPAPDAGRRASSVLRFWRDVVLFSTAGTALAAWRHRRGPGPRPVLLCHVDALIGDIFVLRSLHRSFLEGLPDRRRRILRNPLHLFVLARDALRFRWQMHRRIVALSPATAEEVRRLYGVDPRRVVVIPNGVDLDRFRPSPAARAEVREQLEVAAGSALLLFVGNDFAGKGLDLALGALRQLAGEGRDVHLLVAGSDTPAPFRSAAEGVSSRVHFLGHRDDVQQLFAASDLLVLPTAYDLSPLVGREALAAGLPLLMPRLGGIPHFLRDGENGLFVQRDAGDIARKVAALLDDPERRGALARAARASVAGEGWDAVARRYEALIREVAEERGD